MQPLKAQAEDPDSSGLLAYMLYKPASLVGVLQFSIFFCFYYLSENWNPSQFSDQIKTSFVVRQKLIMTIKEFSTA